MVASRLSERSSLVPSLRFKNQLDLTALQQAQWVGPSRVKVPDANLRRHHRDP